ncbi:MAG: neutral zinc metallopeptidase [Allosphingosinicella sp.]|uniref:KPN_02809 family neutral zinc metallopeptidase n=1 Tax=Allosphingosinicella sp. TaxID=2823234 RepID=UPI00392B54E9
MRFDEDRFSGNIESQRGMGGGGGGLGGAGGLLLGLVASRFGIGGIVVVLLVMFLFGGLGSVFQGGGGQQAVGPNTGQASADICRSDPTTRFACNVYTRTEEVWAQLYQAQGERFDPPKLVFYSQAGRSGCGAAQSAMGPFYCPLDQGIYIDTDFFTELSQRFGAPGDFAGAYVIAHEMGHHIQTISGINDQIRSAQRGVGEAQQNALQVRMELQADCLAGVWAAQANRAGATLEAGDLEEGLRAAAAIGDDTLQRSAGRRPVPESFTHGTSAQRQEALRRGFQGGTPDSCAGYMQGV